LSSTIVEGDTATPQLGSDGFNYHASLAPTPEMRSAIRQNGQCSDDLRDGRRRSISCPFTHARTHARCASFVHSVCPRGRWRSPKTSPPCASATSLLIEQSGRCDQASSHSLPRSGSQFRMIPRWQKQGGWEVFEVDGVSLVYRDERRAIFVSVAVFWRDFSCANTS